MLQLAVLLAALQPSNAGTRLPDVYRIRGPYQFCAETFSIRLVADETLAWSAAGYRNGLFYQLRSGNKTWDISNYGVEWPPSGTLDQISLPGSRVSQRQVTRGPPFRGLRVPVYRIAFFLHGSRPTRTPVYVSTLSDTADRTLAALPRIAAGTMAERGCRIVTRLDRAAQSRIQRSSRQ